MSPKRKMAHPVEIHPAYLAELRRRIESGPGFGALAEAAGMSRATLWRLLNEGGGQRITADAVERVRLALAFFDEQTTPMPPPVVSVQGSVHHAWIAIGEAMLAEEPDVIARVVADPAVFRAALRLAGTSPRRK